MELAIAPDCPDRAWGPVTGRAAESAPPPELKLISKGVRQLLVKVYEVGPYMITCGHRSTVM